MNITDGELYKKALDELDVEKLARNAGVQDKPPSNSDSPDANERQIIAYFSEKFRARRKQTEATLAKLDLDRTAVSSKINIVETRSSLSSFMNGIGPDLERKKYDHQPKLEKAKEEEAQSLRYLRYFQEEHGLRQRPADPRPEPIWHFALVAVFAVIEWVALAIFYAEGSDFGALGGFLMAMALSIMNIGLAVLAGSISRYVNHISGVRRALGLLAALALIALFLIAAGFAAHYRSAVLEIAATSQKSPVSVSKLPALTTLAPSVDVDQWRASKLAYDHFLGKGLVFTDVFSWLLIILVVLFGIIAGWKGYGVDDRYPRYGATSRRYKDHRDLYEQERQKYTGIVDGIFEKARQEQQTLLRSVKKNIEYFQDLASKSVTEVKNYNLFAQHVAQVCNAIVFRYRGTNRSVALSPAPAYFSTPIELDRELMTPPLALTDRDQKLLAEYTAANHEFVELVQKDDKSLQAMRQSHLRDLAGFFERIERTINEKLALEAGTRGNIH